MNRNLQTFLFMAFIAIIFCSCHNKNGNPDEPIINNNMKYRELGNTGLMVSEIGIGCGCFENQDTAFARNYLSVAIDSGVNYIDIYTADPDVRSDIGYGLKGQREKMYIQGHIGAYWENGQHKRTRDLEETKAGFNDLLTRLQTDYIEVGMIHIADSQDDWEAILNGPIMKYAQELKAAGKIKHIGLSSHNAKVALSAVESGLIEVLMFSLNPAFDLVPSDKSAWDPKSFEEALKNVDPVRTKLYATCQQLGVGITVMKVFGAGKILDPQQSPLGKALTVCQCIHYALSRPAVSTVLCGADDLDELRASLYYESATDEEKDYATALKQITKASWEGDCTYCNHCSPCPVGIDIPEVIKLLNMAQLQDTIPANVLQEYKALKHKAGECTQCGNCESRCPFSVSVRENMVKAKELFGE